MPISLLDNKRRRLFLALITIALIQSLCLIAMVYQAKALLETDKVSLSAGWISLAIAGISLIAAGRYLERYFSESFAQQYINELRQAVFHKVLQLPPADSVMLNKGGTLLRLTGDMTALRNWIVNGLLPAVILGIWLLVALLGLTQLHPWFSLSLVPVALLAIAGNYLIGKHLYHYSKQVRKVRGRLIGHVNDKLRDINLIKAFNQHSRERRRFDEQSDRLADGNCQRANVSGLLRGFNEAMLGLGVLTLLVTGFMLSERQLIQAGDIAIVMTAALYLLSHLRPLGRLYELWTLKNVAEHKLQYFFSRKPLRQNGRKKRPAGLVSLQLDNLYVEQRFIPVCAQIQEGQHIWLQGQTGVGKSSLLSVLAGLLSATSGRLNINGVKLSRYQPAVISQLVTLVSADMPLLRGTLRKNLFYGARQQSEAYTQQVLQLCALEDWIKQLPAGLDTRLLGYGDNLSGSQKYKIMLARALLRQPKFLLIDTDASHYDPEIQQVIQSLFKNFEGAMLICSDIGLPETAYDQIWQLTDQQLHIKQPIPPSTAQIVQLI
ncbi:MAG: ABC transporter transmembrane domain-containing protein [Pontibacterium sp.]